MEVREAVVLAAGYGERFYRETGEYKLFTYIHSSRLVE